jgi:hypothetical protein
MDNEIYPPDVLRHRDTTKLASVGLTSVSTGRHGQFMDETDQMCNAADAKKLEAELIYQIQREQQNRRIARPSVQFETSAKCTHA